MERRKPRKDQNDNPFSFRNFLTSPPSNGDSTLNHSHQNENSNNTVFNTRRRETSDRVNNPYSFARFLFSNSDSPPRPVIDRGDNCMSVQGELPDFVQDHFSSSNGGLNNIDNNNQKNGLPDFTHHITIDDTNSNLSSQFYSHRPDFHLLPSSSLLENNEHQSSSNVTSITTGSVPAPNIELLRLSGSNSTNLPDFLSDTGINIVPKDNNDQSLPSLNGDLIFQTTNSHHIGADYEINDEAILTARITDLEREVSEKSLRIRQLEQQLEEQKRKEEEETEIMESMIRQVDENLKRTTESWQNSEREVERLNTHIHHLEARLNRGIDGSPTPMHIVRHIGAQLGSDLVVGEEVIKRFLEHSEKLKILAQHLQYLDRVEDITENDMDHTHS